MAIHDGLRQAYEGYYEDDSEPRREYDAAFAEWRSRGDEAVETYDGWLRTWCEARIRSETPKQHLEIYCHWNGLIGWSGVLYDLAHGGGVS